MRNRVSGGYWTPWRTLLPEATVCCYLVARSRLNLCISQFIVARLHLYPWDFHCSEWAAISFSTSSQPKLNSCLVRGQTDSLSLSHQGIIYIRKLFLLKKGKNKHPESLGLRTVPACKQLRQRPAGHRGWTGWWLFQSWETGRLQAGHLPFHQQLPPSEASPRSSIQARGAGQGTVAKLRLLSCPCVDADSRLGGCAALTWARCSRFSSSLLGLPPSCLLHTPGQLGVQLLLRVSSRLEGTEVSGQWLAGSVCTDAQLTSSCRSPTGQGWRPAAH